MLNPTQPAPPPGLELEEWTTPQREAAEMVDPSKTCFFFLFVFFRVFFRFWSLFSGLFGRLEVSKSYLFFCPTSRVLEACCLGLTGFVVGPSKKKN